MTVGQLLATVSSREISEWQEYFALLSTENQSSSGRDSNPMGMM